MTTSPDLLVIVARTPIAGTTKTRLAATIGDERACALYRAFLADLTERFDGQGSYDLCWGYCPAESDFRAELSQIAGKPVADSIHVVPQAGKNLNERLTNLFQWGFEAGYRRIAIMASDSPHLPESVADAAFSALAESDITLGRVADGGYYLIGLSRFSDLLIDLPMSTDDAASAVAARARDFGLRFKEIAPSFDIDEERDLAMLFRVLAPDGAAAPRTWVTLHDVGLMPDLSGMVDNVSSAAPS